jgi:hypothetical protein
VLSLSVTDDRYTGRSKGASAPRKMHVGMYSHLRVGTCVLRISVRPSIFVYSCYHMALDVLSAEYSISG